MRFSLIIITAILLALGSFTAPAHAQFEDLGDILEDIMGGGPLPGQTPVYGETGIESIPVLIRYDMDPDAANHILVVSAYAPSDPNGGAKKAQLLGQTRLLMTGLEQPLQVTLSVPRSVTKDLPFARITAEILDENTNRVFTTERDGIFRGQEAPELTLKSTTLMPVSEQPPAFTGFETVSGEVSLQDPKARLNGGTLTIQLLENSLAGGTSVTIAGEKVIPIDGAALPIKFSMDRGLSSTSDAPPLAFKAWINDWAGRKTHIMRVPVPYNGADIDYKLKLDRLAQGTNTKAGRNLNPNLMAQAAISGEALYDVRFGIPSDARLKVTLKRAVGAIGDNRTLATQTIIMRGIEGRVPFSLATASTNFDPLIPAPILSLEIVDSYDRVYFDSGEVSAKEGPQTIQLYARRN
ncbi:hypothetical protein N9M10_04645 [Hellea sp.]|nr:hypothetical protein [Hellea sp.]